MLVGWESIISYLLFALLFILGFVFLLTRAPVFRNVMLKSQPTLLVKIVYIVFFGLIGVMGTFTGVHTSDGIANTRGVGVIVAGLVGGPVVGFGAGVIVGVHRFFLGGVSAGASGLAAVTEGILAGMSYSWFRKSALRWPYALLLGFVLEVLHMGMLLVFSQPFDQVLHLVKVISLPMLIINPIGIASFIAIFDSVYDEQEKTEGKAARLALQIAGETLAYLRKGLNADSARHTAQTILNNVSNLDAVAVTSTEQVLAFVGPGADHHIKEIVTKSTMQVLNSGRYVLACRKQEIGCVNPNCPLKSKIVVPLKDQAVVIGALAFYKTTANSINAFEIELIKGLAQLISIQLEVSKVEQESALRMTAEMKALQAQINPHFLFNALNTIGYYCRKQPETARSLILNLADFYRNNLSHIDQWVDLQTEIYYINAYIQIESARFQGKLKIQYEIPEHCHVKIPPLILQPIVENAVKHGLYPKKDGGCIVISAKKNADRLIVTIADNGVGIGESQLASLLKEKDTGSKEHREIGLHNVHQRLQTIYGKDYGLVINSIEGEGTSVAIPFPLKGANA